MSHEQLKACAIGAAPVFAALEAQGYSAWMVGGSVRDTLLGGTPKDIDLATDATPEQALAAYRAADLHVIETGLQHGTLTVMIDKEGYEVTTLRTETEHDGRHASVAWTTSLEEDLGRRDLTINAMAADREGNLIDPYNGYQDLMDRRVRFIGNADRRIQEDYLRILRFFRFHGRFAKNAPLNEAAKAAIAANKKGLKQISVERIWLEISKILPTLAGLTMMEEMRKLGLFDVMGLAYGCHRRLQHAVELRIANPALLMGFFYGPGASAPALKWSSAEQNAFLFANRRQDYDIIRLKADQVAGQPEEWVKAAAAYNFIDMPEWEVPSFPLQGRDLIKAGVEPGPAMGVKLKKLEKLWAQSDYQLSKEKLLEQALA